MLVVDLDRCLGCFACEVGCQQWFAEPAERKRLVVRTIGPLEEGGRLFLEHYPQMSPTCDLCRGEGRKIPFCVEVCPTEALQWCTEEEAERLVAAGRRLRICRG